MTDTTAISSKPVPSRRPWFQFSLRTLLLVMLVFGCGLGWFAYKKRVSFTAWARIRSFEKREHTVLLFDNGRAPERSWLGRVLEMDIPDPPTGAKMMLSSDADEAVKELSSFSTLEGVDLAFCKALSDDGASHLTNLPRLKHLIMTEVHISGTSLSGFKDNQSLESIQILSAPKLTEEGIASWQGIRSLKLLVLSETSVTDGHVKAISGIKSLERLDLSSTNVSDEAFVQLMQMPALLSLDLYHTEITDVALGHIEKIGSLKELNISQTKTTADGIEKLRKKRPDLHVLGYL